VALQRCTIRAEPLWKTRPIHLSHKPDPGPARYSRAIARRKTLPQSTDGSGAGSRRTMRRRWIPSRVSSGGGRCRDCPPVGLVVATLHAHRGASCRSRGTVQRATVNTCFPRCAVLSKRRGDSAFYPPRTTSEPGHRQRLKRGRSRRTVTRSGRNRGSDGGLQGGAAPALGARDAAILGPALWLWPPSCRGRLSDDSGLPRQRKGNRSSRSGKRNKQRLVPLTGGAGPRRLRLAPLSWRS
jgi:hypothetical protein